MRASAAAVCEAAEIGGDGHRGLGSGGGCGRESGLGGSRGGRFGGGIGGRFGGDDIGDVDALTRGHGFACFAARGSGRVGHLLDGLGDVRKVVGLGKEGVRGLAFALDANLSHPQVAVDHVDLLQPGDGRVLHRGPGCGRRDGLPECLVSLFLGLLDGHVVDRGLGGRHPRRLLFELPPRLGGTLGRELGLLE